MIHLENKEIEKTKDYLNNKKETRMKKSNSYIVF